MSGTSRTTYAKRNIIWGFFGKLVTLLGPFFVRTFFIYNLGAEYLGLSSLYTSILSVLSLAELGFASAVAYSLYKPIAEGDDETVAKLLAYFKSIYRKVGLFILVAGCCVIPFLRYLIEGDVPTDVDLRLAFIVYLLNTVSSYFLYAYKQTLLSAYQRHDVISKISLVIMTLQYVLQITLLIVIPNFYIYAFVILATTLLNNVSVAILSSHLFPQFKDSRLKGLFLSKEIRNGIKKRVAGLMISKICNTTRNSIDSVLISAIVGLTAVACYSNYFTILSALTGILGVIGTAINASVGNSVAADSVEKNYKDMRLFIYMYAMISVACAACMISLYQPFMRLWVGEGLTLPLSAAILFVIYFYILTMGDIRTLYVNATGVWWELKWRSVFESVLNIVLDIVLIKLWGIQGAILATIISLFAINFCYGSHLIFKLYFKNGKAKEYYLDHLLYMVICACVCAITYVLLGFLPDGAILWLLLKGVLGMCLSGAILFLLFFKTARFRDTCSFLKKILGGGGEARLKLSEAVFCRFYNLHLFLNFSGTRCSSTQKGELRWAL